MSPAAGCCRATVHCDTVHRHHNISSHATASTLYITAHSLSQITASECRMPAIRNAMCLRLAAAAHNLQSALQMSPDLTTSSHTQSAEIGFQTGKLKQGFVCRYLQVVMLVVCNCRASPQMVGCWLFGSGLISPKYLQYLLSTLSTLHAAMPDICWRK